MLDNIERFDMNKKPMRQKLRPLIWLLCFPSLISHRTKITKVDMGGIKPPYLLLCNHNAFMDFKVASRAIFPHRANYVVAIDGFIKREGLLRAVGGICKRKFTYDTTLVKQLKRVVSRGDIAAIYPEARYSLCGTTAVLPDSIGKLAKFLKVPVVTLICNGHHINSPFWHTGDRHVRTTATMSCIARADDVENWTAEELTDKITKAFYYDDFKWQKDNNIHVKYKKRAEGLHKVLYQCPHCGTEYQMTSNGAMLKCNHCGKTWEMTTLGELRATEGETEFSHIPDWYEWERSNVRQEVVEGRYHFESNVRVDSLPNAKGYINLGPAHLVHDMDGFRLTGSYHGEEYRVELPASSTYSVHIEYNYLNKYGDCIDLNTLNDTLYVYPEGENFSITKISLATEELFKFLRDGKEQRP